MTLGSTPVRVHCVTSPSPNPSARSGMRPGFLAPTGEHLTLGSVTVLVRSNDARVVDQRSQVFLGIDLRWNFGRRVNHVLRQASPDTTSFPLLLGQRSHSRA